MKGRSKPRASDEKVSCEAIVHSGIGEASQRGARVVHGDGIYPVGSHDRYGEAHDRQGCDSMANGARRLPMTERVRAALSQTSTRGRRRTKSVPVWLCLG